MNSKVKDKVILRNNYKTYNPNKKNTSLISEVNLLQSNKEASKQSNKIHLKNKQHLTIETNTGSISHRINKSCNKLNLNDTSPLKKKTESVKKIKQFNNFNNDSNKYINSKAIKMNFNNKNLLDKIKTINSGRNSPSKFKLHENPLSNNDLILNKKLENKCIENFNSLHLNIKDYTLFLSKFKKPKINENLNQTSNLNLSNNINNSNNLNNFNYLEDEEINLNKILSNFQTTANSLKLDFLLLNLDKHEGEISKSNKLITNKYFENINISSERRKNVYFNLINKMKEDLSEINTLINIKDKDNNLNSIKSSLIRNIPSRKETIETCNDSITDECCNIKIPSFKTTFNKINLKNNLKENEINYNKDLEENLTTNVTYSDCNLTIESSHLLIDSDYLNNFTKADEK